LLVERSTQGECAVALSLPITDFEDALVAVCAGKGKADYIITNDKDFLENTFISTKIASSKKFISLYSTV